MVTDFAYNAVYIKPLKVKSNSKNEYGVFNLDGERIALFEKREVAFILVRAEGAIPYDAH